MNDQDKAETALRLATKQAKGRLRTAWIVAAAVGAIVVVLLAVNARAISAWFRPDTAASDSDNGEGAGKRDVPPAQRAAKLREGAEEACRAGEWKKCEGKLNRAQKLDPAGESTPRVQELRAKIAAANPAGGGRDPKAATPDDKR